MPQLLTLLFFSTLGAFLIAWLGAEWGTAARIHGAYNRERLLPGGIETRLRRRARWTFVVLLVSATTLAMLLFAAHDVFLANDVAMLVARTPYLSMLFDYSLQPLADALALYLAPWVRHLIVYLLLGASLIVGGRLGLGLGLRRARGKFLLTRLFNRSRSLAVVS